MIKQAKISTASMPALNVVIVISSIGGGGAERVAVDLANYLNTSGCRVTLVTLSGNDPDSFVPAEGIGRMRLEIRRPARSTWETVRSAVWRLRLMRKSIRSLEPDVVVSFIDQTNVQVLASLIATGIPTIVSERTDPRQHRIGRAWTTARKLTYRLAASVIVQTQGVADWFDANIATRKLVVLPNAVRDYSSTPPVARPTPLVPRPSILGIGRLAPEKGFDRLIDAFSASQLWQTGWHLIILGEGAERARLQSRIYDLALDCHISLPGWVDNVEPWLSEADIFALSSHYEGFPNVMVEAMQLGCAVVSVDCQSGPSDLIRHDKSGLLVNNSIEALTAGLQSLAADPDLRARLGEAAQRDVTERLSPSKIYGRWHQCIQSRQAEN